MGTCLFFALPYHGHIYPCLPILEELARRNETVVAFSTRDFEVALRSAGAEFRELPHAHTDTRALVTMAHWQLQVVKQRMPQLMREAHKMGANYVLVDAACHWGYVLAQVLSLPVVVLHTTVPSVFLDISHFRSIAIDLWRVPGVWSTVIRFLGLDYYLSRRWRTTRLRSPIALVQPREATLQLVLTHECMRPSHAANSYEFVGPCVRRGNWIPADSLPADIGKPLVYVSLGTIWNRRMDFYAQCIEAFANTEYQLLISIGAQGDARLLPALPANVLLRSHVDQVSVLALASAFISHCGMSSLTEAMVAGVPMVLFPQANDQFSLTESAVRRGIAVCLPPGRASATTIYEATQRVVRDPAIQLACRQCRQEMGRGGDAAVRAADRILRVPHLPMKMRGYAGS